MVMFLLYCHEPCCFFNREKPGTAARAYKNTRYCLWHSPELLKEQLDTQEGRNQLRRLLSRLRAAKPWRIDKLHVFNLYECAAEKLPKDFVESTTKCAAESCCFAWTPIGNKAFRHKESDFCAWCDPAIVAAREKTVHGHRLIATALSKWATHPEILLQAWGRLSLEFRDAAGRQATRQKERSAMAKHDMVHSLMHHCHLGTFPPKTEVRGELGDLRGAHQWCYWNYYVEPDDADFKPCGPWTYKGLQKNPEWWRNDRGRLGGCRCELCGKVYLWRRHLADFEVLTGAVEDPVTMDKIIVASGGMYERRYGGNLNLRKQLSDGRTNEDLLRCTLCYEAHCFHCHRYLSFQDFMWADQCRFCHGPMSPQFSRRAWPEPQQLSLGQDCVLSKTSTAAGQWYADWTHQDAISAMAYAVDIAFKCNCCGCIDNEDLPSSRYYGSPPASERIPPKIQRRFSFLSWTLPDAAPYLADRNLSYLCVMHRPDFLCRKCFDSHSKRPEGHKRLLTMVAGHAVNVDLPE